MSANTKEKINPVKKESTENPATKLSAIKTIKALITSVKRPKVIIFIGRVKRRRIGLTKKFNGTKTRTTNKAAQNEVTSTPGNR